MDLLFNIKRTAQRMGIRNPRQLHIKSGVDYSVCYGLWHNKQGSASNAVIKRLLKAMFGKVDLSLPLSTLYQSQTENPAGGSRQAPPFKSNLRKAGTKNVRERNQRNQSRSSRHNR